MILRFIIWSIVLTVVLRFILRFVLPLVSITRMAQNRMQDMQKQMDEMNRRQNAAPQPQQVKSKKKPEEDYIEYEEVK